jgi:hypothetical protein
MFRDSVKVFLAVAFGSYLGGVIGLKVSTMFCWVGILSGGLAGYLSYEWKEVLRAVPKAWHKAMSCSFPKADTNIFKICGWSMLAVAVMWFDFMTLLAPALIFLKDWSDVFIISSLALFCLTGSFSSAILATIQNKADRDKNKNEVREMTYNAILFLPRLPRKTFVVTGVFIALFLLTGGRIKRFCWQMFLLIHSEARLIVGIDAMIGSAIGIAFGTPLMGAMYGGVIGVFNFLIVTELCLKRIFGVIPVQK